eukprot:7320777-Prymnesium_polylepis.1
MPDTHAPHACPIRMPHTHVHVHVPVHVHVHVQYVHVHVHVQHVCVHVHACGERRDGGRWAAWRFIFTRVHVAGGVCDLDPVAG